MKAISAPNLEQFDVLIQQARQQAEAAGLTRADITRAVAKVWGRT